MKGRSMAKAGRSVTQHDDGKTRILFVCTGNICRSPSAEAVVRTLAARKGLDAALELASAGTTSFHVGQPPDPRAIQAARKRGYDLTPIRARQVTRRDFETFDLVLAMDSGHHSQLLDLCRGADEKLRLFMEFTREHRTRPDVPDPYYGDARGFETMLDMVEQGAEGLLAALPGLRAAK